MDGIPSDYFKPSFFPAAEPNREFPASFQYVLANCSLPAFEFGSLMFFANTGEDTFWELGKRLFVRVT
jgi:hypothetical protein